MSTDDIYIDLWALLATLSGGNKFLITNDDIQTKFPQDLDVVKLFHLGQGIFWKAYETLTPDKGVCFTVEMTPMGSSLSRVIASK